MKVGTRRSLLAQAQCDRVLRQVEGEKVLVESSGDQDRISPLHNLDQPGAFTHTLTDAILDGRIDAAVHSLKDLPIQEPAGAPVAAILSRDDAADMLLYRADASDDDSPLGLRKGSRVGTSAPRRQSQLLDCDDRIIPVDVRGNVQTRVRLLEAGVLEGLLMAAAVLERIDLPLPQGVRTKRLDPIVFPPGPGQGTIAVQARPEAVATFAHLDDAESRAAVTAERAVLARLGGGCGLPLGVYVRRHEDGWHLDATMAHDGDLVRVRLTGRDLGPLVADAAARLQQPPASVGSSPPPAEGSARRGAVLISLANERLEAYRRVLAPAGFDVRAWQLIEARPTNEKLPGEADEADWIVLTSARAVPFAREALDTLDRPIRIAAVGPATATALRQAGLPVHLVSADGTGAGLADGLARFPTRPNKVLWPRARHTARTFESTLPGDIQIIDWPVYETVPCVGPIPVEPATAVVLASPSAAAAYATAPVQTDRLVAFGPTTARALEELGFSPTATCTDRSPHALLEVLS